MARRIPSKNKYGPKRTVDLLFIFVHRLKTEAGARVHFLAVADLELN